MEMTLKSLHDIFWAIPDDRVLGFGLDKVFPWRCKYDEVAFSLTRDVTAAHCKQVIQQAYEDSFRGHRGVEYAYRDSTPIHFESRRSECSDGEYALHCVMALNGHPDHEPDHSDIERELVWLLFDSIKPQENAEAES